MISVGTRLLLFFVVKIVFSESPEVERLENIIKLGIQNAIKYELPSDARMYEPKEKNALKEYGTFDFIIIGGGTSGTVIANRLTEIEDWTVLVVEAGNFSDNGFIQFPKFYPLHSFSEYSWGYKTVPQSTACLGTTNQVCMIHRGKGVGGTSLMNGAIYSRGHPENYNQWSEVVKNPTWSYKNVLKYFKKSEKFHWTNKKAPIDLDSHGTAGLLEVQQKVPNFFLNDVFIKANKKLGFNITDYNSPKQIGTSIFQLYTKNGIREDLGSIFITPFLNRPNLKVSTESYVTKIEFNKLTKTAESVIFSKGGSTYRAKATKELILTAGAISSPQILMLSGIGPKKHLEDLGIPLIEDLEVGCKLKDHPASRALIFSSNITIPTQTLTEQVKDYLKGKGTLTAPSIAQAIGFYEINNSSKGVPNLEIISDLAQPTEIEKKYFGWSDMIYKSYWEKTKNAVAFLVTNLAPKSFGTIKLKSNNPFEFPLIDSKLLSDSNNEDIDVMYRGIKLVFKLIQTEPYKKLNLQYLSDPLPPCKNLKFKSKDYWYCFLRQTTLTAYHPVGTCPMGIDRQKGAVVDSNLKVFGVYGLRIADTSVFPTPVAGHPSVPCLMVGEKVADFVKIEHLKHCPKN